MTPTILTWDLCNNPYVATLASVIEPKAISNVTDNIIFAQKGGRHADRNTDCASALQREIAAALLRLKFGELVLLETVAFNGPKIILYSRHLKWSDMVRQLVEDTLGSINGTVFCFDPIEALARD